MSGTVEFMILFGVINVVFFLPFYLFNVRNQPNPFQFLLSRGGSIYQKLKGVRLIPNIEEIEW